MYERGVDAVELIVTLSTSKRFIDGWWSLVNPFTYTTHAYTHNT